jgi:hypothetical protein
MEMKKIVCLFVWSPGLVEKTSDINPPLKSSIRTLHSWFGSEKPAKVSILSSQLKIAELNEVGLDGCRDKILASLAHCYRSALRIGEFPYLLRQN